LVVESRQESRAAARKPRDAEAVLFGLKFANNAPSKRFNYDLSAVIYPLWFILDAKLHTLC